MAHSFLFRLFPTLLCLGFSACRPPEGPATSPPPDVLTAVAGVRKVDVYREWVGTLDGSENAEIRARVSGYLTKRNYQEGAIVKKGDVLFEIDARPSEAALAEARSQLLQAQAVQLASQADFERSRELFNKEVISEKEYTNKTQMNESNLAKVEALKSHVEQAELNVKFCTVVSPVEGIAGIAKAQVGDLVGSAGGSILTTVSTLDPIKILFPISEVEFLATASRIQQNLSKPLEERPELVELVLADGKPYPKKARILSVDRQVQASTGTILVTALAPNPESVLRPGLFARARVIAATKDNAVVIPQRAILEVQGTRQVGVIGPDGKAEIRPVVVGPAVGSERVIESGLEEGETYVVEGIQKIRTGLPVNATPWVPPGTPSTPGAALN